MTESLEQVSDAFVVYGLRGQLVVAPERNGLFAQLNLAAATTEADRLLAWMPPAPPMRPRWLRRLVAESGGMSTQGLLSPALVYQDGSIFFGGAGPAAGARALSGYGATRLHRRAARQACSEAVEFWCLDCEASQPVTPMGRLLRQIDAAVLDANAAAGGREAAA